MLRSRISVSAMARAAAGPILRLGLVVGLLLALFEGGASTGEVRAFAPAPVDEDGRFTNLDGPLDYGAFGVRFPFFLRRIGGTLRGTRPGAPTRIENDGAFVRENALHSEPTITWVGHATLLVQMEHVTFLTDPIWSDTASPIGLGPPRFVPPGLEIEALPPIDFVLISHNHYDHLDLDTLEALAEHSPEATFFVPRANGPLLRERGLERVVELDWGDRAQLGAATIHCLPSQHWSRRGLTDMRRALWAAWAVTGGDRRFYFGGDTGYFSGFRRVGEVLGPFDLAALPIGAYEPRAMMRASHLNPEEAVQAGLDLRAERIVGMHFGTFDLSDEPLDEPPRRFREAAREAGFGDEQTWILSIGETRRF